MYSQAQRLFLRPLAPHAAARVVCFPCAGGTATMFDALAAALAPSIDVCAFELPGRQNRMREPFARSMHELLQPLVACAAELFDRPYVLLGHSLGSWMAFELARKLRARRHPSARALVVMGERAPDAPRRPAISQLSDAAFSAALCSMGGIPRELLDEPELMELLLPRMRADFALAESYVPPDEPPLPLQLVAVGGSHDPTVPQRLLQAWSAHCSAGFEQHVLTGDHFFVQSQTRALCALVERILAVRPLCAPVFRALDAHKELS